MPFCPQCHAEYRDGFTVCADCGVELIRNECEQSNKRADKKSCSKIVDSDEVLLTNTNDAVTLSYLTSMLKIADIPYRVIALDISQYLQILHGKSYLGSCVYVTSNNFCEAQEILKSLKADFQPEDELVSGGESMTKQQIAQSIITMTYLIFGLVFLGGV